MIKKFIVISVFVFAAIAASPLETRAQYVGTSPFIRYSNNIFVNSNMHLFFQKRWQIARLRAAGKHQVADAMEGRRTSSDVRVQTAPRAEEVLRRAPLAATSFRPAAKAIMPDELTKNLEGAAAEEKAAVRQLFIELLTSYDEMLAGNRETRLKNNVAGAAAFALLAGRFVLTGTELSESQSEALLQDINALLASADKFKNLPARDRQVMYETFAITGGLALMYHRQGTEEGDKGKINEGKELAKFLFSQFFEQSIDEISFTDEGVQFQ